METQQTVGCQRKAGEGWEKTEGISQITCMNDPWTWTTMWGWTVKEGSGLDRGGQLWKKLGQV